MLLAQCFFVAVVKWCSKDMIKLNNCICVGLIQETNNTIFIYDVVRFTHLNRTDLPTNINHKQHTKNYILDCCVLIACIFIYTGKTQVCKRVLPAFDLFLRLKGCRLPLPWACGARVALSFEWVPVCNTLAFFKGSGTDCIGCWGVWLYCRSSGAILEL